MENKIEHRLKELRAKLGLTQREIATSLGMKSSYYSDLENGHRTITGKFISKLGEKYNASADWMYTGKGDVYTLNGNQLLHPLDAPLDAPLGSFKGNELSGQKSLHLNPYYYYNQLTDSELEFEISIEIERFSDTYNDYKKLVEALHELDAPDFLVEKFKIPPPFNEWKIKTDKEFESLHIRLKDARKRNLLIIVDLYQAETDHWRSGISQVINYIHQYSRLILSNIQTDIKKGVSILNKASELKKKREQNP